MLTLSAPLRELFAQGGTLLVPSRQRAAAVRLAWAGENLRAGRRSWATPDVLTPAAWLQQQLTTARQIDAELPRLLGAAEEWVLWQRAASERVSDGSALLSTDALARSLRSAAQRASDHGIALSTIEAAAGFDLEASWLLAAMAQVERAAAQLRAMPLHRALQCAPAVASPLPLRTLGVEPLPAAWGRLLSGCGAAPLASSEQCPDTSVRAVSTANAAEELRSAAQWCREKLAADPQARLLVVIPDLTRVRDGVTQLWLDTLCPAASSGGDDQHDVFVLEGGETLSAYPWIAQALDGIAALSRPVSVEQLANWLLSPFWPAATRGIRAACAIRLRRHHFQPCSLRDLLSLIPATDAEPAGTAATLQAAISQAVLQWPAGRRELRDWVQAWSQALMQLGCIEAVADSALALQLRARWQELLEDYAAASRISGPLAASEAAALLIQLAHQASFAPATGDPAVTITSSLDHPVVRYDGIWVCRCSATAWPAAATPDPFMPRILQMQAGIREASATGQLAIATDQLGQWRACTSDLRLSWPVFIDDADTEASALLHPFSVLPFPAGSPDALHLLRATAAPPQHFDDDIGPAWLADQHLPAGSRSLELQSDCAFRAFAELRLGAAPLEQAEPGIDRRERGKLLHRALEIFWGQTQDLDGLLQLTSDALTARIADAVSKASALQRQRSNQHSDSVARDWHREEARTRRQIQRLCEFESQRSPFRVAAAEHRLDASVAGAHLRLRFDRIDELPDGTAALIDYKSSEAPQGSRWLNARPAPVQLLVYLAALPDGRVTLPDARTATLQVAALATLHIGRRTPKFHGVSDVAQRLRGVNRSPGETSWKGDLAEADWPLQQAAWRRRIHDLAQQFLHGRAVPDPEDDAACSYCELTALCRRVERVRSSDQQPGEESDGAAVVGGEAS